MIHSVESAKGLTANQNAMGAYKASFLSMNDPVAVETRAKIVAGLVREELAHSSLHALWLKTQKTVQSRATVISSTDDLLEQNASRMDVLRRNMVERQQDVVQREDSGAFVEPRQQTES